MFYFVRFIVRLCGVIIDDDDDNQIMFFNRLQECAILAYSLSSRTHGKSPINKSVI